MKQMIEDAIRHKGFSVVEILTQCPTYFGRKNKVGDAVDMLNYYKDQTVPVGSEKKKENPALIERGNLCPGGTSGILRGIRKDGGNGQERKKNLMERYRVVFSGSGGQGVITASIILAEAAVLYEGLNAVQSQSYGP
jgi:pyruvate/2-oxoacid:ferredoxin oxidoreductase beta subunit